MVEPSSTPLSNAALVPRPVTGVDVRRLPIGPEDAFVLSRVDGVLTQRDIGYCTGLLEERVAVCLETLERLGAIDYAERPHQRASRAPSTSVKGPVSTTGEIAEVSRPIGSTPSAGSNEVPASIPRLQSYDPAELDTHCDLDVERRKAILDLYYQLEVLDHYVLLGVPRHADKKQVKGAYYDRVKTFHPDRYYGKELAHFRAKLEKCFGRLTDAHDTLTSGEKRQEYDAYLLSQAQIAELERAVRQAEQPTVTSADFDDLERRFAESFSAVAKSSTSDPTMATSQPEAAITYASGSGPVPSSRQLTDEERRKALARKLRPSQANLRIPSQANLQAVTPSSASIPPREHIAEQLKRQYELSRKSSNQAQLAALLADADDAIAKGDPVRAANALRTAQSQSPKDTAIAERLAAAQEQAAAALADTYLKQGEYEEKSGRWEAAARSYERAARGKPLAGTWESAARCLLETNGDLRAAGEYVRKAMVLSPGRSASHLLLGRIFMAARMRTSAVTELERARSLDPNNSDTVANLLKRLERESL